jgi:hypothetical protein
MIDMNETGTCSMRGCSNEGKRARGAQDIERCAEATGVFRRPSFYCEDCLSAAAQRSLIKGGHPSTKRMTGVGMPGGTYRSVTGHTGSDH